MTTNYFAHRATPRAIALAVVALGFSLCSATAMAQTGLQVAKPKTSDAAASDSAKVSFSLGVNRSTNTLFKGLTIRSRSDVLLDFSYEKGRLFASMQNGIGYKLVDEPTLTLGLSANYMPGRYAASDSRYAGMGDVGGTVAAYGFAEWRPVKDVVTVYGSYSKSTRSANGSLTTLGTTLGFPVAGKLNGFFDLNFNWGSSAYTQSFYGVNAAQSVGSGYAVYSAPSGLVSSTPTLGLVYEADKHWSVIGYAGQTRLSSTLAASPLVTQRRQPVAALLSNWTY